MKLSKEIQEWFRAMNLGKILYPSIVLGWADKVAQLEARIKALEANTSKSVLRRLDAQLGGSDGMSDM